MTAIRRAKSTAVAPTVVPATARPERCGQARPHLTRWDLRKIRTRRLLLRAGREVFANSGSTTPRVEDVAREAGISRAGFYLHFGSLEGLIEAVFEREVRWQLRRYRSLTSETVRDEGRMRSWLEGLFASFRAERRYMLIMYRALAVNPAFLGLMFHEREQAMLRLGRRVPALRVYDAAGQAVPTRLIALLQTTDQIEDLSLFSAFNSWNTHFDIAVDRMARAMVRLAAGDDDG